MAIRGALGVVKRPLAVWALSGLELGSVCPSVQKCAVAVRAPLPRPSVRYAVASLAYSGPLCTLFGLSRQSTRLGFKLQMKWDTKQQPNYSKFKIFLSAI